MAKLVDLTGDESRGPPISTFTCDKDYFGVLANKGSLLGGGEHSTANLVIS
jgi:hypothetical protein